MIENPQPAALIFLLMALPGIAAVALALARRVAPAKDLALVIAPGIAVTLALLPLHFVARWLGGLASGLVVSWVPLGALGYGLLLRRGLRRSMRSILGPLRLRRLAIATFVAVAVIAPATLFYDFHDETLYGGHHAMIANLQNGAYPPRFLYAPAYELRYHYGFDLAAAVLTATLRLRVDQAIDVLTLTLWGYTFVLLWFVGERLVGRGAGAFVALVTSFASFVCHAGSLRFFGLSAAFCDFGRGGCANPPFVSYFFQHPWALGVPLFLVAILVYDAMLTTADAARPWSYVLLLLCLSTLFLSQIVLFTTLVLGIAITEGWRLVRERSRSSAYVLATLLLTGLLALRSGGFLAPAPFAAKVGLLGSGFLWAPFSMGGHGAVHARWLVATFGLLLPLGVAGLVRMRRQRMLLSSITVASLGVVDLLTYSRSWDIAKFGTVAALCLGIGTGALLYRLWRGSQRATSRIAVAAALVAVTGPGFAFITEFWSLGATDYVAPYWTLAYPVRDHEAAAISFLRKRGEPSDIIYRRLPQAHSYARWGGLSTVWSDEYADAFGVDHERVDARRADLSILTADFVQRLAKWGVRWVVVDDTDPFVGEQLESAARTGKSELVTSFGDIRVYALRGRDAEAGGGLGSPHR